MGQPSAGVNPPPEKMCYSSPLGYGDQAMEDAERAKRLEALIAQKREALAQRRAPGAMPSRRRIRIVAAACLVAALGAWLTGLPRVADGAGWPAMLGDLHPLFFGAAVGLLAAGFQQSLAWRRTGERAPEGARALLWVALFFLVLNLAGSVAGFASAAL